ncbi:MAG: tryptophan-rich sensory protein [Kofleriaceae bacterium]|jgi:benzodiazapine receptor|nr:tryptophan-rich sensory protein [Kofleriaceae bacterium]MBP6840527.1 tryptophan-rich sensory protein [Kofleriaceae bacterium]MBP9206557.1 tryptophan-rich sensory protein [Kofleriaceae bacterium]
MPTTPTSRRPALVSLAACLGVTFLAPLAGAWTPPSAWYAGLAKPSFTPPGWLFGPAWTVLYVLMAVGAWMVWRQAGPGRRARPLALYGVQLALNAAWTPVVFGAHQLGWGLVTIVAMWLAIALTIRAFWQVRPLAGALLLPYLAWVTFATTLNAALWRLNG